MAYKKATKAVITDAGFASRFLPITKTIPKAMLPLGPKPIMQYVVEECVAGGIKDIIIVSTPEGKHIYEDYFSNPCEKIYKQLASQGKLDRFESVRNVLEIANIKVIEQDQSLPYGNGSPIASAKPYLNDDEAFLALYSDDLIFGEGDVKTLMEAHETYPDAKAIITAQEMPQEVWSKYGMIALKDEKKMTLSHIVEKRQPRALIASTAAAKTKPTIATSDAAIKTQRGTRAKNGLRLAPSNAISSITLSAKPDGRCTSA